MKRITIKWLKKDLNSIPRQTSISIRLARWRELSRARDASSLYREFGLFFWELPDGRLGVQNYPNTTYKPTKEDEAFRKNKAKVKEPKARHHMTFFGPVPELQPLKHVSFYSKLKFKKA